MCQFLINLVEDVANITTNKLSSFLFQLLFYQFTLNLQLCLVGETKPIQG